MWQFLGFLCNVAVSRDLGVMWQFLGFQRNVAVSGILV